MLFTHYSHDVIRLALKIPSLSTSSLQDQSHTSPTTPADHKAASSSIAHSDPNLVCKSPTTPYAQTSSSTLDPLPLLPGVEPIEAVEERGKGVFVTEQVAEEETFKIADETADEAADDYKTVRVLLWVLRAGYT